MLSSIIIPVFFITLLGILLGLLIGKASNTKNTNELKPSSKTPKSPLEADSAIPPENTENPSTPNLNGTPDPREKN